MAKKVGDELESGDMLLRLSAIELHNDIRSIYFLANDEHRTNIARLGLLIKGLLNPRVPKQDQISLLEIGILNPRHVLLLEALNSLLTVSDSCLLHISNILRTSGKLMSPDSNELFSRDTKVLFRSQVGNLNDIKVKERVDAMGHVVGRIACSFTNSNLFCPEDLRWDLMPFRFVFFTSLYDCLANVVVS